MNANQKGALASACAWVGIFVWGACDKPSPGSSDAAVVDSATSMDAGRNDATVESDGATADAGREDGPTADDAAGVLCGGAICDVASRQNVVATCASNRCTFPCATGFADCDMDAANGCEADLSSPATCGRCSNTCPTSPGGTASCNSGTCELVCATGLVRSGSMCTCQSPRPTMPLSGAIVQPRGRASGGPTVRFGFESSPGVSATIEFCADRECATTLGRSESALIEDGSRVLPEMVRSRRMVFWRTLGTVAQSGSGSPAVCAAMPSRVSELFLTAPTRVISGVSGPGGF